MKSFAGICITLAVSSMGTLGCGAAVPDENVAHVQEALNISTWNGLLAMQSTGSYTLTADINASGKSWTPKSFSGTFDGGNHTISNLSVNGGGFFLFLSGATVKNVRFTNLTMTGSSLGTLGALAASADDSTIDNVAVESNINISAIAGGGFFGMMNGGSIHRSYAKGSISGTMDEAGGFVGLANTSSIGGAQITESYTQMTVNIQGAAGGLVGIGNSVDIHDAYAVGNVTGRGSVGGIVGSLGCSDNIFFLMYKTIYRGNVVDLNNGSGWAGGVGTFVDCTGRMEQNFYDRTLDTSANHANHHSIQGYTSTELRSPTSVIGGVFCAPDTVPGRCGDNTWSSPPWTAGTNMQHHALLNMPGPNIQPR